MSVQGLLQLGFKLRALGSLNPERIARHERFAEDREIASLRGGLANPVNYFG